MPGRDSHSYEIIKLIILHEVILSLLVKKRFETSLATAETVLFISLILPHIPHKHGEWSIAHVIYIAHNGPRCCPCLVMWL